VRKSSSSWRAWARSVAAASIAVACVPGLSACERAGGSATTASAAIGAVPSPCPPGRFTVTSGSLTSGPGANGREAVVLDGLSLSITTGCPPVPATFDAQRQGIAIQATWPSCLGFKGPVHLTALIDSSCDSMTGTLRTDESDLVVSFTASRLVPEPAPPPPEVCDGVDNDGDGIIDNVNRRPCCPRGPAFVAGRLVVGFKAGTPRQRAEEIARAAGASGIENVLVDEPPLYLVAVPVGKEMLLILAFRRFPEVVTAETRDVPCLPEHPPCEHCPCGLVCPTPRPGTDGPVDL